MHTTETISHRGHRDRSKGIRLALIAAAASLVLSACTADQAKRACAIDAAAQPVAADATGLVPSPGVQAGLAIDEALVHPMVQAGCAALTAPQ